MISDGKVVKVAYTLKDQTGAVLDQADSSDPLEYLHGKGNIVPGLEQALDGLKVGDKKDVVVAPDQGYGPVMADLKVTVQRQQFPKETDIQVGMQFLAEMGSGGKHPFTVVDVEGDKVGLDGNHPLAGQTLHFTVTVEDIREATEEELQHGHAHGPGGHHH